MSGYSPDDREALISELASSTVATAERANMADASFQEWLKYQPGLDSRMQEIALELYRKGELKFS